MSLPLVLHDTLTRSRKPVTTSSADRVTLYVCGPTVYNYAHIGNARPAVVFDLLARVLRCHYREVVYVSNFTDVELISTPTIGADFFLNNDTIHFPLTELSVALIVTFSDEIEFLTKSNVISSRSQLLFLQTPSRE